MSVNSFTEMILGFSVILVILVVYILTLITRARALRKKLRQKSRD